MEACRAWAALGPVPLPSWPLHGRGQPTRSRYHKNPNTGVHRMTQNQFLHMYTGQLAGSAE